MNETSSGWPVIYFLYVLQQPMVDEVPVTNSVSLPLQLVVSQYTVCQNS